jgi:DNA-binding MarR family transcriptional regulator
LSRDFSQRDGLQNAILHTVGHNLSEQMAHYHEAIAGRLGLTVADHKVFDLVCGSGSLTAGQLAEVTNLTSGAVTGLVDRLEKAGVVQRQRDPEDRRRVIIQPNPDVPALTAISDSLALALTELCSQYSDQELAVIADFTERLVAALQSETAKL